MEALAGLGTAANVIAVVDLAARTSSALAIYVRDAAQSSSIRGLLAQEATLLQDLLQSLLTRVKTFAHDPAWPTSNQTALSQLRQAHLDLAKLLKVDISLGTPKKEDRFHSLLTAAKWPFSKTEVYTILERVARLQQYVNTLLLADQTTALERLSLQHAESARLSTKSEITRWLSPLNMATIQHSVFSGVPRGSAEWFLKSEKFVQWSKSSHTHKRLWGSGIPGAGKTVVASVAVDHLREVEVRRDENNSALTFVFLKYDDQEQTHANVLGSILGQLLGHKTHVPPKLEALYRLAGTPPTPPTLDSIQIEIRSVVQSFAKVYIVLDGLDECSDDTRWLIMESLRTIGSNAHLFVTSRARSSIAEELFDFERLEISAKSSDIELFVDTRLQTNPNLQRIVKKHAYLRDEIIACVTATAQGMFLLVRLHLELVARATNLPMKLFRQQLHKLPTSLYASYDEIMNRIRSQDVDQVTLAIKTIAWVTHAVRPLTLKELQQALAVDIENGFVDEEMITDGSGIASICEGLLVVDEDSDAVGLVHYSAKHYLESNISTLFPDFHEVITECCVACLQLPQLSGMSVISLFQEYPLVCYAAQYLGFHARSHTEDSLRVRLIKDIQSLLLNQDTRRTITKILDTSDLLRAGFFALPAPTQKHITHKRSASDDILLSPIQNAVMALQVAILMGLVEVAAVLIKTIPDIDITNDGGRTALSLALEQRFETAATLLIKHGAQVDLRTSGGRSILLRASENDWHIVCLEIAHRAKEALLDDAVAVQLLVAAVTNKEDEVESSLHRLGCDVKTTYAELCADCLFISIERAKYEHVDLLLKHGVDCDARDALGNTAMHRAARRGNTRMLRLLLRHGAAVDPLNDQMMTPWSANLKCEKRDALDALLLAGADPNTKGWHGASELYSASAIGDVAMVNYMIQSGTNPSIKTDYDWAPLHWASHNGHLEVVRILIAAGCELNALSDQGSTPLDLATDANQEVATTILLSHGARRSRDLSPRGASSSSQPDTFSNSDGRLRTAILPTVASNDSVNLARNDERLLLTFDQPYHSSLEIGQFIYTDKADHSSGQDQIFYQLSHPLSHPTKSLGIRRATDWVCSDEYPLHEDRFSKDDCLYNIHIADEQQLKMHLEPVTAKHENLLHAIVRRNWDNTWSVHQKLAVPKDLADEIHIYRVDPVAPQSNSDMCMGWDWTRASDGQVVGRNFPGKPHSFRYAPSLTDDERHFLVACWVCKLRRATISGASEHVTA